MAKYLNLDGLQTLWAKLKDTFALKKHSHTVEDIPVDSALSSTSENPVQNKVVNTALAEKRTLSYTALNLSSVNTTEGRYWLMAKAHVSMSANVNVYGKFRLIKAKANTTVYIANVFIDARFRSSIGIVAYIEDSTGADESTINNNFVLSWDSSSGDVYLYVDRNQGTSAPDSWASYSLQQEETPYGDYGRDSFNKCDKWTISPVTNISQASTGTGCVSEVAGTIVKFTQPTKYHVHNDYVPFQKKSIYGCMVKRLKTGGNWYDNVGFQIAESYASSFRTHWVTFRWASAAQMNGTTNLGCRRFLFGYEETGRFLRCFVSEDDTYWYVWILFMTAKTGGAIGLNTCSVMEMQTVPNGLEVLTTAPDLTNLTEIPWAADERYAPKSHTHAGTDVTSAVNYSKMQEAEFLDNTKDIVTEIKKINTRCVKWYRWNETSRPTNAPTNSARSLMQAIVQYEGGVRITLIAYPQDTSAYYYIAHYAGTAATTISWRIVYTVPTSTYDATGTRAVNGTAVASAISAKANAASVTGATKCKVTYNNQGIVTAGADLAASDIPNLAASKITSGTFADERIASASKWNAKQDALTFDTTPTESSSNPVTSAGVKSYVDSAVTGLYKYRGSVNTAYINALQDPSNGDVYNISASGTITNGEGGQPMSVLAGDNVAFVLDPITSTTYWDKMSSELDLSNFVDFDDIATATTAGVVKSSSTNGNVGVDASGVMTVNGWSGKQDALTEMTDTEVTNLIGALE